MPRQFRTALYVAVALVAATASPSFAKNMDFTGKCTCKKGSNVLATYSDTVCVKDNHAGCTAAKDACVATNQAACTGLGGKLSHSGAACTKKKC